MPSKTSYYPKQSLPLQPSVAGARMWAVALERTMLTYFEIEPHCRFQQHAHESEQITLVLEGELYFTVEGRTECVKAGEVIALPGNVPHAAFAGAQGARAVDAWSPVMPGYIKA